MSDPITLTQRIATAGDALTPIERRVAALVLDDSTVLAFGTVAEVAQLVDASGPTIVRFATKLGFEGYGDLQHEARRSLSEQLKRPTDRIRQQPSGSAWEQARAACVGGVEAAFESVGSDTIRRLAEPIAQTEGRLWITASESSAAGRVLASGLSLLRPGVHHLTGSPALFAAELTESDASDTVLAIDFVRYERSVVRTTELLSRLGATVIAITDSAFSPLTAMADMWCEIAVPAVGPFDSTLPAIAVVEALVAEVAHQLPVQATARIDRAEALWSAEGIFLEHQDRP